MKGNTAPFIFSSGKPLTCSPRFFLLAADHHVDHHHHSDDVRDHRGQVGVHVIVLKPVAQGVEEAEHQGGQVGLARVGGAEDDAGKGHIAPAVTHALGKHGHIAQGQLGPGQAAESAAEDGGEPLHLLRADSGSPKGTGLLPGGPNPEAPGSPVDKGPHQGHQAPGEENKEGAAIQHVPQEGDLLQKSQVHLGKPHHWPVRGPLEGTLHLKQSPQEEDGEAPGKDVEGSADDEFVTLELHHEEGEEQAHQNSNQNGCHFGGLDSGSTEATTDVFIESAYFHPTWVRKTARRHGLNTDASFRFERGIDPNGVIYCLKLAAIMVKELAGGTISSEIKDVFTAPAKDFVVELNYGKVHSLVGKVIPVETIKSIVTSLEMKITNETAEGLTLSVPPYRVDVQRDCDVIEDILRIYGYNNVEIPSTLKSSLTTKGENDKSNKLQNLVAEQLVGCGFNEILNNSLTRAAYYDGLEAYPSNRLVMLLNPLSADLNCMRQTLLFGGLESIAHNANRKNADLKFFEFGNCYYFDADKKNPEKVLAPYTEDYHLGLWVTGKKVVNSWAHPDESSSVYELKAYVENILKRLGLDLHNLVVGNLTDDIFAAALSVHTKGGKRLASFGVVTKKLLKAFDIDNEVYYADLNWKELMKAIRSVKISYKEISKFPAVKRDLALLLDKNVQFAEIEKIAYDTEKKLLKEVELFDVYEGKNLEPGKKSYAVSFLLQDESQTLNDKMIDKIMSKLVKNLEDKLGAKLR